MAKSNDKARGQQKPTTSRKKPVKKSVVAKRGQPSKRRDIVEKSSVRLLSGKGSVGRGGGSGGHYWHVYMGETRVGYVYINILDEAPFGKHASIQIHINQTHRHRGIGSIAYQLACEQSGNDEVIATMRKSNLASQKAAAHAGFEVIDDIAISQMAMRWKRSKQ